MSSSEGLDPSRRQYLRVHVRDLLSSETWHLLDAEGRGAYLHCLFLSYLHPRGCLPNDAEACRRMVGIEPESWSRCWPVIRRKFILKRWQENGRISDGLCNPRVRQEIAHGIRRTRSARTAARKRHSAAAMRTQCERNAEPLPRASESSSLRSEDSRSTYREKNAERSEKTKKKTGTGTKSTKKRAGPAYSAEFEAWWRSYPRKTGKGAAWKSWARLRPEERQAAIRAEAVQLSWPEGLGLNREDPKYTPHPATWLNQRRWEDELQAGEEASADAPWLNAGMNETEWRTYCSEHPEVAGDV